MKLALSYREDAHPVGEAREPLVPVESYARCVARAFRELGHETTNVYGINSKWNPSDYDLYLELDNGRDKQGNLGFGQQFSRSDINITIPIAAWFIDSHGQPELHRALAPAYDHLFFAVWDKRNLFSEHKSAHWCPCATDPTFFYPSVVGEPEFDFGFFGSKTGLDRADKMVGICQKNGWKYDVRQVGAGPFKHKWPRTSDAMNNCKVLFNHGQKHDGPNQRVTESMAVGRPLISDSDPRSGTERLFEAGVHFMSYEAYTYNGLEEIMTYAICHPGWGTTMADRARQLVLEKHTIKNRVEQMLEVFNATL